MGIARAGIKITAAIHATLRRCHGAVGGSLITRCRASVVG